MMCCLIKYNLQSYIKDVLFFINILLLYCIANKYIVIVFHLV